MEINLMIKVKNYTVSVPHVQILLTGLNKGLKVEEYETTGTKFNLFLHGLKPEFTHITGTKRDINPFNFKTNFLKCN